VAAGAVIVAFALRLVGIETFPPGLYRDEAYYALDAVAILEGARPAYLEANNGREPLYAYLTAAPVALLGRTPVAARLASVWVGVAAVAAVYAAAAQIVGSRRAAYASCLMAVLPWSVMLGRLGLRAGTLAFALCLAIAVSWRGARAWQRGSPHRLALVAFAGGLAGLSAYTYTAVRMAPFLVLASLVWFVLRRGGPRAFRHAATPAAVWLATAALITVPLAVAAARDPDTVLGRPAQVALTRDATTREEVAGALLRSTAAAAGMFTLRGDDIPRHNPMVDGSVTGKAMRARPVFALPAALLFLVGLGALALGRRGGDLFVLAWLAILLLPTILAEDAPHYLRAVGALPAAVIVAACGLWWLAERTRRPALVAGLVGATALAFELGTSVAMVVRPAPDLADLFETGASDLARAVNSDLGGGWQGGWAEAPQAPGRIAMRFGDEGTTVLESSGERVWLDRRLRDGWASVPYLVELERDGMPVPKEWLTLTDPYDPILSEAGSAYLWPYELELDEVWAEAAPLSIGLTPGAMERGDLEPDARLLYAVARGGPLSPERDPPLARFGNGLALQTAEVTEAGGNLRVETKWGVERALERPATMFVQVLEGDRVVAGQDAPLGNGEWPSDTLPAGLFPSELWRAGQSVNEVRWLEVPGGLEPGQRVVVGLYEWLGTNADQRADVEVIGDAPEGGWDRVRVWP
jgi:4-amino-4-deoxy-L-arabinose transferase-like glycosyltransferase